MLCYPLDNTEYEAEGLGLEHVTRTRGVYSADGNLSCLLYTSPSPRDRG